MPETPPEFHRVSFAEAARAAAPAKDGDDNYAATIANEAAAFPQLQAVQLAFDQLAGHVAALRRGEFWPFEGTPFPRYAADVVDLCRRHRDVLRTAADAADAMIRDVEAQLTKPQLTKLSPAPDHSPTTPNRSPNRGRSHQSE